MAEEKSTGLVSGKALETPKARAQAQVVELIGPAAQTLAKALETSAFAFEKGAQAVVWSKQVDLAMQILQACMDMSGDAQKDSKTAARILASVGGDAVTRELAKRYALKQRMSERARIVEAVPARSDTHDARTPDTVKESASSIACDAYANDDVSRDTDTSTPTAHDDAQRPTGDTP